MARAADDGFRSTLVMGVRASADAERLADELAFATGRLTQLEQDPPGLYAEVAAESDPEEAAWLAFLIAYLSPLEDPDPFRSISAVRTSWASGELPDLDAAELGPRSVHDPARGAETLLAYRAWAGRAGSQARALAGEDAWTPIRRFDRVFERLALPGFGRMARFDLLVTLGWLGLYPLRAERLHAGVADDTTIAAKRVFGIGDTFTLERRAADLVKACDVPFGALDLALYSWGRDGQPRAHLGASPDAADPAVRERVADALGV